MLDAVAMGFLLGLLAGWVWQHRPTRCPGCGGDYMRGRCVCDGPEEE